MRQRHQWDKLKFVSKWERDWLAQMAACISVSKYEKTFRRDRRIFIARLKGHLLKHIANSEKISIARVGQIFNKTLWRVERASKQVFR